MLSYPHLLQMYSFWNVPIATACDDRFGDTSVLLHFGQILCFVMLTLHPYFIFAVISAAASDISIEHATMIGFCPIPIPYIKKRSSPNRYIEFQSKEMSFVDFVFHAFMTCGISDSAIINPAKYPIICIVSTMMISWSDCI